MTTRIVDDWITGLSVGYRATDWTTDVSFDDYVSALFDWDIKTIVRNETPIGAIFSRDGEVHVSILPEWRRRWLTKGLLAELTAMTTTTRVTPGHEHMYAVLDRLGFKPDGEGGLTREHVNGH